MVALAAVMGQNVGDMSLNHLREGLSRPTTIPNPARELRMPRQCVATKDLARLPRNVGDLEAILAGLHLFKYTAKFGL